MSETAGRSEQPLAWPRRGHWLVLAVLATVFAVYGSWVPLNYRAIDWQEAVRRFREIPFLHLTIASRSDWVANILLFVPISFSWLAVVAVDRRHDSWGFLAAPLVILACVGLSVALEFSQLWFPPRTVSQNDIVAESLGGVLGTALWLWIGQAATDWIRLYSSTSRRKSQVDWLLQAYLLGLVIYSLLPLDLTISAGELWAKYREGKILLVPFAGMSFGFDTVYQLACGAAIFVPVGIWAATWMARPTRLPLPPGEGWGEGRPPRREPESPPAVPAHGVRRFLPSLLLGLAVAVAIEVAQLFVYSRYTSTGEIIVEGFGVGIGVALARWWYGGRVVQEEPASLSRAARRSLLWLAAAGLYAAFLVVIFCVPFQWIRDPHEWKTRLDGFFAVPFSRLYFGTEFHATLQVLRKTLFFAPLGALLATCVYSLSPPRAIRRALLAFFLVSAAAVGAAIELAQVFLAPHTPDTTDVLLYSIGAGLGMLVTIRLVRPEIHAAEAVDSGGLTTGRRKHGREALRPAYLGGLDGLRALACLGVFGVHLQQMTGLKGSMGPFDLERLLANGNTGVCTFFMLSGALLSLPLWSRDFRGLNGRWLAGYAARRVVRILPAYYACLLALVVLRQHWHGWGEALDTGLHLAFLHNYRESTFYSIAPPFWTIAVQMQFYVLLPVIFYWLAWERLSRAGRAWVVLALAIGCYLAHYWLMENAHGLSVLWGLPGFFDHRPTVFSHSVLAHLPHLLLGVLAGLWLTESGRPGKDRGPRQTLACDAVAWSAMLAVGLILATRLDDMAQTPHGRYHLPWIPVLVALLIVCMPRSRTALWVLEKTPLRALGVISFGVYVYHYPVMRATARLMDRLDWPPTTYWCAFALASLGLTIVVSWLSYRLLEAPLAKKFRRGV